MDSLDFSFEDLIKRYNASESDPYTNFRDGLAMNFDDVNLSFKLPILGYAFPVLCLIVLVTNTLFVITFTVGKMNSATHILLKNIAIADTLTIVLQTICYVYVYTLGNYKEFVPFVLCEAWYILAVYLPTIFHTASIWLTCILAIQRYICVSYPLKVRIWCGVGRTYVILGISYGLSIGCHISRFFETEFKKITVHSRTDPSKTMESCHAFVTERFSPYTYIAVYSWARAAIVHILPCIGMIVFSGRMLYIIKKASKNRQTFQRQGQTSGQNDARENRLTTWLVIFVVASVIVVEMPSAIYFIIFAADTVIPDMELKSTNINEPITVSLNVLVSLSYPLLFIMYCCMSKNFRKSLKGVCCRACHYSDRDDSGFDGQNSTSRGGSSRVTTISDGGKRKPTAKSMGYGGGSPLSDDGMYLNNMSGKSREIDPSQNGGKRRSTKISILSQEKTRVHDTKTSPGKGSITSNDIENKSVTRKKNEEGDFNSEHKICDETDFHIPCGTVGEEAVLNPFNGTAARLEEGIPQHENYPKRLED